MPSRDPRSVAVSRRSVIVASIAGAAFTVELVWLIAGIGGPRVTAWFANISGFVAPTTATVLALLAATRNPSRAKAWRALAAASGSWALGQMVWSYYELVLGREVPFPSLADVGFLGMYPLALVGVLLLPAANVRAVSRLRAVLDGLIVGGSLLFAGWSVAIDAVLSQPGVDTVQRFLGVTYPVGDVVLCTVALTMPSRRELLRSGTSIAVLTGIAALGVSDFLFTYLTASGEYASGSLVDIGWFSGFLLIGLAAALARETPVARDRTSRWTWSALIYLPTVAVIIGEAQPTLDKAVAFLGATVFALVIARQVTTSFENRVLTRDLETRVEQLWNRDEQFRLVLRATRDAVWDLDLATDEIAWGDGITELFGYAADTVGAEMQWWADRIHPEDRSRVTESLAAAIEAGDTSWTSEYRFLAADGRWVSVVDRGFVVAGVDGPTRMVGAMMDISERKQYEDDLAHRALHDPLTGLPNRALLVDTIRATITEGRAGEVALLFLDLDHFKRINDTFGHAVGDDVIIEIGHRLVGAVRDEDLVARFGGDEFVILCTGVSDDDAAREVVERVLDALATPVQLRGRRLHISASVGVALGRDVDLGSDAFLQSADTALYEAKARGRARFEMFNESLSRRVRHDLELTEALRQAIVDGELSIYYQPVVDLATRRPVGVEALLRWEHSGDFVPPSTFVRLAEEAGLIDQLGDFVLERSCAEVASWSTTPDFQLSVNVSPLQLSDTLAGRVASALASAGLAPEQLCLELTERALMRNPRSSMRVLRELRALGVRIAIDDFGTGYSSLSYLSRLPLDVLKIDRSFIAELSQNEVRSGITEAIIAIARAAGLTVIAEGIEHEQQAEALTGLGCTRGQGYLFARPHPGRVTRVLFESRLEAVTVTAV